MTDGGGFAEAQAAIDGIEGWLSDEIGRAHV